jgi:hypothetical protein
MKVLTTSNSNQTLKFIPREYVTNITLKLRDDSTNEITTSAIVSTTDRDYMVVNTTFDLKEGTLLRFNNFIWKLILSIKIKYFAQTKQSIKISILTIQ